jgi:hypothetical protein
MRPDEFNILFYGGRLFQQWLMGMYVKVESMRLDWYSLPKHQKIIQAELCRGIVDTLKASQAHASEFGRLIVLPRNFNGGEYDVQAWFLHAMTLVQRFGMPDYFVTITCNPYWEEIGKELFLGQTLQDCPELVARVYRSKLHNLHDRLIKKKHFGEALEYAHVTEFQKCGLSHEHFLLVMANRDKLRSPDEFDKYIFAEIPDKDKYAVLHEPCGVLNDKSYPVFRRRNDGQVVEIKNAKLDNRWVIPFNPSLLMLYNCHINVEICSSIKAVKYLYKYIYKGPDGASYSVDKSDNGDKVVIDEIKWFRDAICVTPPEAAYQLYGFSLY